MWDQLNAGKVAFGVAAAWTIAYAGKKLYNAVKNTSTVKDEFGKVAVVSAIYMYPVKSCRGILMTSVECQHLGFRSGNFRDREFVIIDSKGNFITARQEPAMIRITPSLHDDELWLDAPEMETFKLKCPIKPSDNDPLAGKVIPVRVFKDMVSGVDCGNPVSDWLSKYLGREGVRMAKFHLNKSSRVPEQNGLWERLKLSDNSIYADLTAYMCVSEASLQDLNEKLAKKVTIRNFRPNIVVRECDAFNEESWKDVKIGDVEFRQVKPCTRCVLTTIDPETGIKDGIEPLQTLKSYRQIQEDKYRKLAGESPVFGVHFAADKNGTIKVGQPVYASLQ